MISTRYTFVLLAALMIFGVASAFAQESFSDPNVDYSFTLPGEKWKMTAKPSATNQRAEFVYGDRSDGHLQVRKITVGKNDVLSEVIRNEESGLQFQDGYVAGKNETFEGKLKGIIFNYEYVAASRNRSGRFYYLRANDTTVYVLRFTGEKESIRSIRAQTDSIARTFDVKQGAN